MLSIIITKEYVTNYTTDQDISKCSSVAVEFPPLLHSPTGNNPGTQVAVATQVLGARGRDTTH